MRTQITTIIGALVALFGLLSQPQILNMFPAKYGAMFAAAGTIVTMLGRSLLAPTNSPSGITAQTVATALKVDSEYDLNKALVKQDLPTVNLSKTTGG